MHSLTIIFLTNFGGRSLPTLHFIDREQHESQVHMQRLEDKGVEEAGEMNKLRKHPRTKNTIFFQITRITKVLQNIQSLI